MNTHFRLHLSDPISASLRGDTEALDAVRNLMPGTVSTYQGIFDEVVEYAKTEKLTYKP